MSLETDLQTFSDILNQDLPRPVTKEEKPSPNPERCKYNPIIEKTKAFLAYHSNLLRAVFATNEEFKSLSEEEADICWRLHWVIALKAITRWKREGKRPDRAWLEELVAKYNLGIKKSIGYFVGFANAMIEAYDQWFEGQQ